MDLRPRTLVQWFTNQMERAFTYGQQAVMNRLGVEIAEQDLRDAEALLERADSVVDRAQKFIDSDDPVKRKLGAITIASTEETFERLASYKRGNVSALQALHAKEANDHHPTSAGSSNGSTNSPAALTDSRRETNGQQESSSELSEPTIPQPKTRRRRGRPTNVERELRRQAEEAETNGQASSEPGDR